MSEMAGEPHGSRGVMEHQPLFTQEKMKTSYQLRSRKNVKVARATVRVNNRIPATVSKKTQKTSTTKNLKKILGSKLCSQCFKVNKELNAKETEAVPESTETPAIPANQNESEKVPETTETPAIPTNQNEPENIPETLETPAIPAGPVDSQ